MEAYLDNSATTRVCAQAVRQMTKLLTEEYGNPSSLHEKGMRAAQALARAREQVARRLGCDVRELVFTSGGTESNNLALFGAAYARRREGNRIVTTAIEHPSVEVPLRALEQEGFEVIRLPVGSDGRVSRSALLTAIDDNTILVSMMLVNNEIGSIQPIEAAADAIRQAHAPALLHCDAVQAFGKLPFRPSALKTDLMTVSSHKIHGPKGAGALYIRKGVRIRPRSLGGGQEGEIRPGTEAMPAIGGFGAAAQVLPSVEQTLERVTQLRDYLLKGIGTLEGIVLNSPRDALPYVTNFSVTGLRSELLLNFLSERGIYVSSGSACAKGHKSRILSELGLPAGRVDSALRVSFSRDTTREEIDYLLDALQEAQRTLRHTAKNS